MYVSCELTKVNKLYDLLFFFQRRLLNEVALYLHTHDFDMENVWNYKIWLLPTAIGHVGILFSSVILLLIRLVVYILHKLK